MFKNLFDLSLKRSGLQAFGFYLFYSIVGSFIAGFVCAFIILPFYPDVKTFQDSMKLGIKFGPLVAVIYAVGLSLAIIFAKKIQDSVRAIFIVICTVPIVFFCGTFLGLIPVALLTTLDNKTPNVEINN